MAVNMFSNRNRNRNMNATEQTLRRMLLSLSKDVRELKLTTGAEATVLVETKDNKLYYVKGQRRLRSMRVRGVSHHDVDKTNDDENQVVDPALEVEYGSASWYAGLSDDEIEAYRMAMWELMEKIAEQKSVGSYTPGRPAPPSWEVADRDGSASASVSPAGCCGLGGRRGRKRA